MLLPSEINRPVFLMCPPFSLSAEQANNVFMRDIPASERKVDREKALRQFLDLYSFISSMALVYLLPSRDHLQDCPFVANLGIILPHKKEPAAVISNFRSPPRRGETALGEDFFRLLGYEVITAPPFFEGEADLKYIGGNHYAGGWGMRTNSAALVWFERTMGCDVIPIRLTDSMLYHLDCAIFPLSDNRCLAAVDSMDKDDVSALEKVTEIIPVSTEMARQGITNCVRVNRLILSGACFEGLSPADAEWQDERRKVDTLTSICARYGYDPVFFEISEFGKSGAALSCLVMHLNFPALRLTDE